MQTFRCSTYGFMIDMQGQSYFSIMQSFEFSEIALLERWKKAKSLLKSSKEELDHLQQSSCGEMEF